MFSCFGRDGLRESVDQQPKLELFPCLTQWMSCCFCRPFIKNFYVILSMWPILRPRSLLLYFRHFDRILIHIKCGWRLTHPDIMDPKCLALRASIVSCPGNLTLLRYPPAAFFSDTTNAPGLWIRALVLCDFYNTQLRQHDADYVGSH